MKKFKSSIKENLKALLWALLIAGILRTFFFEPFKIPSGSMKPNLLVGDFLFVSKWDYGYSRYSFPFGLAPFQGVILNKQPQRGDIVVFKLPGDESINYVKRLIGLPGDEIQIINGIVHVKKANNEKIFQFKQIQIEDFYDDGDELYINQFNENNDLLDYKILDLNKRGLLDNTPIYKVPNNQYFFMGDNRDNSADSRILTKVGFVPKENLIGKVRVLFFSINKDFSIIKPWTWFQNIRYNRIFDTPR